MRQEDHAPGLPSGPSPAGIGFDLVLDVNDRQTLLPGLDQADLRGLVARVLSREGIASAEISLVVVDDAAIREINRTHLSHDWETDVITFPLSDPGESPLCGELILSAETAKKTAESVGADPRHELALYVVHGLMHLVGLDDATPAGAGEMRRREAFHLAAEGLTNTFDLVEFETAARTVDREDEPCTA